MNTPQSAHARSKLIHIIAGDMDQFRKYLDNRDIPRHMGRYVVGPIDLSGLPSGTRIILTGTYFHKNNWDILEESIKQYQLESYFDPY